MSPQIVGLAPATRVVSRKLGPNSGRRSDSSAAAAAACWTSTLAITCGRWLTVAISRSWLSASIAWGRAPRSETALWSRSYRTPLERSVGVRYQRAPSNRSARAFSTPAVSAPASGCPPMKRSSAGPSASRRHQGALGGADVGDHRVLAARRERLRDQLRKRPNGRRAEDHLGARRPPRRSSRPPVDRLPLQRALTGAGSGSKPLTSASSRRFAASRSSRRSARPRARRASSPAASLHRAGEPVEDHRGSLPVETGIGDRLAVGERSGRSPGPGGRRR